jgi:hypothetical protein
MQLSEDLPYILLEPATRPLFTFLEQETFLQELEDFPPKWELLKDLEGEDQGDRLFTFNRQRDDLRENHPLLQQRVAFLWSGLLRRYFPDYNGFTVAIGPQFTPTAWGILRFKPMGLPDEMIAIPPPLLTPLLKTRVGEGKPIDIGILFIGRLDPYESIMYAFSHTATSQGMIMPIVLVEDVKYFIHPFQIPKPESTNQK